MNEVKRRLRQQAEEQRVRDEEREKEVGALLTATVVAQEDELWRTQSALTKHQTWKLQAAEAEQQKAEPVRRFKWATSLDEKPMFDPASSHPRDNILDVGWGPGVTAVVRSGSGALGVFFVNTEKGTVVLKGSRSIASEAFASLLAAKLSVAVPRWRILSRNSREGSVMLARLSTIDPAQHASIFLSSQLHVFVNAFVPGWNLSQLDHDSAIRLFGPEGSVSKQGEELLRQLGHILALDVLVNNGDRLPLIWENRGNAGNIIIAATNDGPRMYSIDTQVLPIGVEHEGQMDAYLDKVGTLVKATVASARTEIPQFAAVRQKLKEFLRYDVGAVGSVAMQRGFLEVVSRTRDIDLRVFELEHWRELLRGIDENLVGLDSVQPDFVMAVWSTFAALGTP